MRKRRGKLTESVMCYCLVSLSCAIVMCHCHVLLSCVIVVCRCHVGLCCVAGVRAWPTSLSSTRRTCCRKGLASTASFPGQQHWGGLNHSPEGLPRLPLRSWQRQFHREQSWAHLNGGHDRLSRVPISL